MAGSNRAAIHDNFRYVPAVHGPSKGQTRVVCRPGFRGDVACDNSRFRLLHHQETFAYLRPDDVVLIRGYCDRGQNAY